MLRIPNPAELTAAQREHIAAFILTYPTADNPDNPDLTVQMVPLGYPKPEPSTEISDDDAIALLTHDQETTLPELAFALTDDPSAAFGSAPVNLPTGATAVPSIAAVNRSETAHGETSATLETPSGSVLPAQTSAASGVTVAPNTGNLAEVDKTGLPWDGRIHSRTKSLKVDGTWTAKRGVDPALVTRVEAELRQVMGAPTAVVTDLPPNVAQIAPTSADATGDERQQFIALVGRTSAAINGGKVTQAEVKAICVAAGLPSLPMLANRLDLVAQIAGAIDALIASRG